MLIQYKISHLNDETGLLSTSFCGEFLDGDSFVCRLFHYEKWLYRKDEIVPNHSVELTNDGIYTLSVSILRNGQEIQSKTICFEFFSSKAQKRLNDFINELPVNDFLNTNKPPFFKFQDPYQDFIVVGTKKDNLSINLPYLGDDFRIFKIEQEYRNVFLIAEKYLKNIANASIFYSGSHIKNDKYYLGMNDISNNCHLDDLRDNLGGYTLFAIQDDVLFFETDYFGMCQLYVYDTPDCFVVSNRYQCILYVLQQLNVPLHINIKNTLSTLSTIHALAEQPLTNETFVSEISILDYGNRLTVDKFGLSYHISGAHKVLEDSGIATNYDYNDMLELSKKEIIGNVNAILTSGKFKNYVFDLTGGQDSRLTFGALMNLPEYMRHFCKLVSFMAAKEDFTIANALAVRFGMEWDYSVISLAGINRYNANFGIDEHYDLFISLYMGKGIDPVIINSGIDRLSDTLHINGGSGELFRHLFAKNYVAPSPLKNFKDIEDLVAFFDENRRYGEFICDYNKAGKYFIERFEKRLRDIPVTSVMQKYETLYAYCRNRFHFSPSRDGGYRPLSFTPNMSKNAYKLYHQTFDNFSSRKLMFDLMHHMHPEIAQYPYEDSKNNEARDFFFPEQKEQCQKVNADIQNIPFDAYLNGKEIFEKNILTDKIKEHNYSQFKQINDYKLKRVLSDFKIIMSYNNGVFREACGNAIYHLLFLYQNDRSNSRLRYIFELLYVKLTNIASVIKMIIDNRENVSH